METPLCASGRRGGSPIGGEWEGKKECVFVCDCVCFGPHMTHVKGDISDAAHVGVVFFGTIDHKRLHDEDHEAQLLLVVLVSKHSLNDVQEE